MSEKGLAILPTFVPPYQDSQGYWISDYMEAIINDSPRIVHVWWQHETGEPFYEDDDVYMYTALEPQQYAERRMPEQQYHMCCVGYHLETEKSISMCKTIEAPYYHPSEHIKINKVTVWEIEQEGTSVHLSEQEPRTWKPWGGEWNEVTDLAKDMNKPVWWGKEWSGNIYDKDNADRHQPVRMKWSDYKFMKSPSDLVAPEGSRGTKNWKFGLAAVESRSAFLKYSIPASFALAVFILVLIGLKKFIKRRLVYLERLCMEKGLCDSNY